MMLGSGLLRVYALGAHVAAKENNFLNIEQALHESDDEAMVTQTL